MTRAVLDGRWRRLAAAADAAQAHPPEGWVWRYLPRTGAHTRIGAVLHALDDASFDRALCGVDARGRHWRGDDSQTDRTYAAGLPLCTNCMRVIRVWQRR